MIVTPGHIKGEPVTCCATKQVDFYATWCGPCQMLSPILSAIDKRMEGRIAVVKVDSGEVRTAE
jgi:thiol-disulfide isomerase/thioredoxin